MSYTILIPIHNEINSIPFLLNSLKVYYKQGHEVIIIDDGSDDGSTEILNKSKFIKLIIIDYNKGKGFAIKQGLKKITNDKVLIFDGDMEINPIEISKLMLLDKNKNISCVMGHRFKSLSPFKSNFDWGNFMFTSFFNIVFKSNHKDILCCAKAFYYSDIKKYVIISNRFEIDVELTSFFSILYKKREISAVLLNYHRRTIEEGKKLKISDGWSILSRIIKMIKYL
tara:strand:+ start:629 stop:1306 length:678 start_codon:yes stop_codon:yes gene_type:complete